MSELIQHYENYDEKSRMFRSRARSIEFSTTLRVLEPWLARSRRVLELGAANGTYTAVLLDRGLDVHASDLVPAYVAELQTRFAGRPGFRCSCLDAVNLEPASLGRYDLILCLGPYYHLQDPAQRDKMLGDLAACLRPGGILAIATINRHFAFTYFHGMGLQFTPEQLELFQAGRYRELKALDTFLGLAHFSTPAQVESEVRARGLEILDHVGVDGFYHFIAPQLEALPADRFQAFLDAHWQSCRDPSILGLSNHGLVICRK